LWIPWSFGRRPPKKCAAGKYFSAAGTHPSISAARIVHSSPSPQKTAKLALYRAGAKVRQAFQRDVHDFAALLLVAAALVALAIPSGKMGAIVWLAQTPA